MIFLAPIAGFIAGAIGCALVVLLYMLKLRRRPVSVSSTLLWSRAVKDMEGNIPWQKLSPTLLLWLHLLIVILFSLAIARPIFDDAFGEGQRVYLIIDTSASMNAKMENESGLDRAKEQAIDRVRTLFDSGRTPSVTVVSSSLETSVVLADSMQRGRIIGAINSIETTDQPGELADAISLIESMQEAGQSEGSDDSILLSEALVWMFTDGGSIREEQIPMRGGNGVSVSPFDGVDLLGNIGLVAIGASRDRADPAMCRLFVRVGRSSNGPAAAVIRVFDGDAIITSRAIAFENESVSIGETIELRLMQGLLLRVELEVEDALSADNRAWAFVPDPSPVRITVVAPGAIGDPLLIDMLEVIARTKVRVVDELEPIIDADLVVYDRVSPAALPDIPTIGFASLLPEQSRADQLDSPGSQSRMISWDRSDAIVRDAGVGSVSYQRSTMLHDDGSENGMRVLARDGQGPVISEWVNGSNRHLRVGFALHDSNWAVQVGLPIFLINAVEQLLPGTGGIGEVYTTTDVISLEGTDGQQISIGPIDRVGVIEMEGIKIGVSLLDSTESSLPVRKDIVIGSGIAANSGGFEGPSKRELWRWFTLAAILLIAIEWFVYSARVKIV